VTGLNDHPVVLGHHRMIFETPSLAARVLHYMAMDEEALAEVTDEVTACLVAGQVLAVQRVLSRGNWLRLVEGEAAEQVYPLAVAAADRAFRLLPELR
jgi:hypothetical protein